MSIDNIIWNNMYQNKFRLFTMLLLCIFAGSMEAQKNLTVYNGTAESGLVPIAGVNLNYNTRSQYVIPAANLTDMAGGGIYGLIYYLTDLNGDDMPTENVNVYVKEVNYTTISAFESVSNADLVYEGALTLSKVDNTRMMIITFKTPYIYKGGNLLIDFENPVKGKSKGKKFYGKTVTGASLTAYNTGETPSQCNFIPRPRSCITPNLPSQASPLLPRRLPSAGRARATAISCATARCHSLTTSRMASMPGR